MKYEITKRFTLEASHQLPNHDGKCRRLHGHSYVVEVTVRADGLETGGVRKGMVTDFANVKALMKHIIEGLDHQHLNDTELFPHEPGWRMVSSNPTAETLAAFIFSYAEDYFNEAIGPGARGCQRWLERVTVRETDDSWATVTR